MNDNAQNSGNICSEDEIFALDIGTRTVVGVLGHVVDDTFVVDDCCSVPHKSRAMTDGQIEDIDEVAKIAGRVKAQLEERNGITLTEVSIAAAGRALKTCRTKASMDIEDKGYINDDMLKSLEMDAIADAQDSLDGSSSEGTSFYCVGNTVVKYFLDDYPIKSLKGHRGKNASAEILAAFLPSPVVESLYSVMDKIGLSVRSLTLEPIAAMNIIIPAEVRLINIALVDIGAGTSDIAISRDGSIVAYAMATIAGDEITEEIIRKYLVDFNTAEEMKQNASGETITYKNILGMEQTVQTSAFFESLFPTVDLLADTIAANILEANGGEAPAAVFLVGGGSQVPELSKYVAQKLGIPEERAAVGGRQFMRSVDTGNVAINGPEFVTPIGIGVTATIQRGYDFSTITLNGEKIRVFDTKKITVVDLLRIAGYKPNQIIGRSGRNLTYILNGERKSAAGTLAVPAEITVNGKAAAIDTPVKQGDTVTFKEAENGVNAQLSMTDIAGDVTERTVTIDGMSYPFGTNARVNDKRVTSDYKIQNYDDIAISVVETLGDLMLTLPFDCNEIVFMKNDKKLRFDYLLCDGDKLETCDRSAYENIENGRRVQRAPEPKPEIKPAEPKRENKAAEQSAEKQAENAPDTTNVGAPITVILNGRPTLLEQRSSPHEFLELMALADLDTKNPPPGMNIVISLNGKDVNFMDPIKEGDVAVIRWE